MTTRCAVASPVHAAPGSHAWFLDFDGTLVEIAAHPDEVEVPAALRTLIGRLHEAADGALAVVTGRSIERLDRFLSPLRIPAAGVHGCQYRPTPDADIQLCAAAGVAAVRRPLRAFCEQREGLWLEDKGASLALHYRQVPQHADAALELARQLAAAHPDLTMQTGKFVVELRPGGTDKAGAIERFMAHAPFAGRRPVFIGDDDTDEPAFEWVNRRRGLSIRVGKRETTAARHVVADVTAALSWLRAQLQVTMA